MMTMPHMTMRHPCATTAAVATFCKPQQPHFREIKMGKAARLFFDIVSPALSHRTGRSTQRSASPASSSPGTMGGGTGRAGVTIKSARYSLSAAICASSSSIRRRISRLSLSVSGLATGRVSGSVSGPTSGPASGTQIGGPGGICGGFLPSTAQSFSKYCCSQAYHIFETLSPAKRTWRNTAPQRPTPQTTARRRPRTTLRCLRFSEPPPPFFVRQRNRSDTNLPFFSSKVICRNSAAPTTGAPVPVKTVPSETLPC